MWIHTYRYTRFIISVYWKGLETITNPVEMMIPSTQKTIVIYPFPSKEAMVLGKGLILGLIPGHCKKMRLEHLGSLEPDISRSTNISCFKCSGANMERLPLARDVI